MDNDAKKKEDLIKALVNCVYNGYCINCDYKQHMACKTFLMREVLTILKAEHDGSKK